MTRTTRIGQALRVAMVVAVIGALAVAGGAATSGHKGGGVAAAATLVPAAISNPGGPLTNVDISTDLNCKVDYLGDTSSEFFGGTACGTFVAVGGTLYGPVNIPAGGSASPRTGLTAVSQSQHGAGTAGDPYVIDTRADAGAALHLHQLDTYVAGQETYRTDTTVTNPGNAAVDVVLYKAADCFLQNSDFGPGTFDASTGAVSCLASLNPGARIEQFFPISSGSRYVESNFSDVWALVGSQQPFPNECRQCANNVDNGMGLSWTATIPAGGSITRSHLTNFSPLGNLPLQTTKTARDPQTAPGGTNAYTITIDNPNAAAVTVDMVTDHLPTGFSYIAGSTTGTTTADPAVDASGSTLVWPGPFTVAAGGHITFTFGVRVSATEPSNTYFNEASAEAVGVFTVVPTGPTAPVVVGTGPTQPMLTVTVVGSGTVASNPVGISCPTACSAGFATGTMVTLTPTPASGATFTGWSGACTGSGACTVTMDAAKSVTATFAGTPPPSVEGEIEGEGHYGVNFPVKFDIEDVQRTSTGALEFDSFTFSSKSRHLKFEATGILSFDRLHNVASFTATGELNGHAGYTAAVTGVDMRHRHGTPPSRISIELKNASGVVVFSSNGLRHVHDGDITIEREADE